MKPVGLIGSLLGMIGAVSVVFLSLFYAQQLLMTVYGLIFVAFFGIALILTLRRKRVALTIFGALATAFSLISGFSIGLFLLPGSVMILVASLLRDERRTTADSGL